MTWKMIMHTFEVEGSGEFPWDMLRYDSCFPLTQEDTVSAEGFDMDTRRVTMARRDDDKDWFPTSARWESFGWRVVPGTHKIR